MSGSRCRWASWIELREQGTNDKRTYRVHGKLKERCYRCETPIARVDYEEHTVFCPSCQTGGRVLKGLPALASLALAA